MGSGFGKILPDLGSSEYEMLNSKLKVIFINSLKSFYLVIICNLPLTRRKYKGKTYVKNIRKKSCRIRNQLKCRIRPGSMQHCFILDNITKDIHLQRIPIINFNKTMYNVIALVLLNVLFSRKILNSSKNCL
jgi:hypothetical protein